MLTIDEFQTSYAEQPGSGAATPKDPGSLQPGFRRVPVFLALLATLGLMSWSLVTRVRESNRHEARETSALSLSHERLEWLRGQDPAAIPTGIHEEAVIANGETYLRRTEIFDDVPEPGMREITVRTEHEQGAVGKLSTRLIRR